MALDAVSNFDILVYEEEKCGLEPSTNWVGGRAAERAADRLQRLEPGESRNYNLEIGVLASQSEIDAFARNVSGE